VEQPQAGKAGEGIAARNAPDNGRAAAAAAAAETMILHAQTPNTGVGVAQLDRGRRRTFDVRDTQTATRTIAHAPPTPREGAPAPSPNCDADRWQTSNEASQNARELKRATRRMASRKMRDASRHFHRTCGVPGDELAALSCRREAQEGEWRRLLRKQRAGERGMDLGSLASYGSTLLSSALTGATSAAASRVTAGMGSGNAAWRAEDNGCAAYGRQCIALCPGDATSMLPPLPLDAPVKPTLVTEAEYRAELPPDNLSKLSRMLCIGSRPT